MTTPINPFVPEDIIINILLRLPAKSIGRCHCVSKQWRCLLSQPHFIKTHIDRARNSEQYLLLVEIYSIFSYATLDYAYQVFDEMHLTTTMPDFSAARYFMLGFVCCDGLVLTGSIYCLFLINPITNQVKQILFPNKLRSTFFGLGYDSDNHDYKIVTLTNEFDNRYTSAKVFSVKNGAWKNLNNRPYDRNLGHGVFINGYIHWLVSDKSLSKPKILSFDLVEDKFYEVLLPTAVAKDIHYNTINDIVLLKGCLCVSSSSYSGESCVWIMKESGNNDSWTKFTFIVPEYELCKPICMLDQEHVLLLRDLRHTHKPVKYNLKNGTYKNIVVDGINPDNLYVRGTFVESLVSPFCSDETS